MIATGREDDSLLMMYMKFRVWRYYHHESVVLSGCDAVAGKLKLR